MRHFKKIKFCYFINFTYEFHTYVSVLLKMMYLKVICNMEATPFSVFCIIIVYFEHISVISVLGKLRDDIYNIFEKQNTATRCSVKILSGSTRKWHMENWWQMVDIRFPEIRNELINDQNPTTNEINRFSRPTWMRTAADWDFGRGTNGRGLHPAVYWKCCTVNILLYVDRNSQ